MEFRVIKSSFDGICGGDSAMSIDDACREISHHKGWATLKELHTSLRKWAKKATPGSVFKTAVTVVVATAGPLGTKEDECPECGKEGLDYEELMPIECGSVKQEVSCPQCGERWLDVFVLAERHALAKHQ